jgi:hypothetical protein
MAQNRSSAVMQQRISAAGLAQYDDGAFELVLGAGPDQDAHFFPALVRDTFLIEWTEWLGHDGKGLPEALLGKTIMVAGSAHDGLSLLPERFLVVTSDYAASSDADLWDWSKGYGGISAYRRKRIEPLSIDQSVIDALLAGSHRSLLFGLDGVAE